MISIADREQDLVTYLKKQPYITQLDGITLAIAKNVFPSDFGLTSPFVGKFMLEQQPAESALDMGCGSGYFTFLLRKMGCDRVLGVDFNPGAVMCALENKDRNPELTNVDFLFSDLFSNVPIKTFDLIMFNFNYYPSNGTFGLNEDGGREILERFFSQVGNYITEETRIYVPYSQFVGAEHDPKNVCAEFGFSVKVEDSICNHAGEHYIYKIMQK